MRSYVVRLTGCRESLLLEVEAPSLADLAQELTFKRFLVGRMVAVDGEFTSREVTIAVRLIEMVAEPD